MQVDMAALRHMGDDDLKELGVPMVRKACCPCFTPVGSQYLLTLVLSYLRYRGCRKCLQASNELAIFNWIFSVLEDHICVFELEFKVDGRSDGFSKLSTCRVSYCRGYPYFSCPSVIQISQLIDRAPCP